ncbi:MAG: hypothetical protein KAS32_10640 [Candidatus Peribacteraceae bacterium]|nr:hypothetical protein [Candidatus Peribacteraceae bacterium]
MKTFNTQHKYFARLSMVCKSVAEKETSTLRSQIKVDNKHIVATDRKRLACLDNFGLSNGRYIVHKCTKNEIVLISVEPVGIFPQNIGDLSPDICDDVKFCLGHDLSIAHYCIAKQGACLSIPYLKDYMAADKYHVISPTHPVLFYAKEFIAVIMPMNVN